MQLYKEWWFFTFVDEVADIAFCMGYSVADPQQEFGKQVYYMVSFSPPTQLYSDCIIPCAYPSWCLLASPFFLLLPPSSPFFPLLPTSSSFLQQQSGLAGMLWPNFKKTPSTLLNIADLYSLSDFSY
jgi:hypothetical protein